MKREGRKARGKEGLNITAWKSNKGNKGTDTVGGEEGTARGRGRTAVKGLARVLFKAANPGNILSVQQEGHTSEDSQLLGGIAYSHGQ